MINRTRGDILIEAHRIINGERLDAYGSPEDNFTKIADLWSAYLHWTITPLDVALMMTLFKIARIQTGSATKDSFTDAAGYIALGDEIKNEKD